MTNGSQRVRWVLGAALIALGCGGGDGGPSGPPKIATITVTSPASQLEVGSNIQMTARAVDSKGTTLTGRVIAWQSSSPTTATVDATGVVHGVAPGPVTITASAEGVSGTAQVTVIQPPVVAVVISPRTPSVKPGETTQLTAVAQDGIGRPMNDRPITWTSRNAATATISNAGLVTGVATGTTWIIASTEGKSDSVTLRVKSLLTPTVSTTAPATWTPGIPATVTGTNFSATTTENVVFVNGVTATVSAATPTQLNITVPSLAALPCSPTGPIPVVVVVNGDSATGSANLAMATQRTLGIGQSMLLTSQAEVACNEFAATGGRYLVTAFNYSTNPNARISFQLLGASQAAGVQSAMGALPPPAPPVVGPLRSVAEALDRQRLAIGHAAVLRENIQRLERSPRVARKLSDRRVRARQGRDKVSAASQQAYANVAAADPVPPPNVGDKMWKRMRRNFSDANTFDSVRVRVVYVGPKLIILEDTTNALAGTLDAEYQAVGAEFDQKRFGFLASFGDPLGVDSLTDNNGRVVAIFSKKVNEYQIGSGGNLLGFVTSCDFYPQTDPDPNYACPTSNEGEYFYAFVPNPGGIRATYTVDQWKRYVRGTIIHEFKHVVMFVQRIIAEADFFEETWLEEATAQVASELWARSVYGFGQRTDITWDGGPACDYATVSASCPDPVEAIGHHFQFLYQHYNASESRTIISNQDVVIYGSSWSFARWVTDHFDGGDEATFLRSLVQQKNDRGVTNIRNRTGKTWAELLGQWSMASLADNYPAGTITDARLSLPSWNTRDVFAGMNAHLVFRNPDGTTTPAFPREWPLNVRTPFFGNFAQAVRFVSNLPGGGFIAWDISGAQTAPQVLGIRSVTGTQPPPDIGMVVLRVQ